MGIASGIVVVVVGVGLVGLGLSDPHEPTSATRASSPISRFTGIACPSTEPRAPRTPTILVEHSCSTRPPDGTLCKLSDPILGRRIARAAHCAANVWSQSLEISADSAIVAEPETHILGGRVRPCGGKLPSVRRARFSGVGLTAPRLGPFSVSARLTAGSKRCPTYRRAKHSWLSEGRCGKVWCQSSLVLRARIVDLTSQGIPALFVPFPSAT